MTTDHRPPGGTDLRNWQPATAIADYVRNCRDGLEEYSDTRAAQLLGWTRVHLWRAKLMAEIPPDLFERLIAAGIRSTKALANIGLAYQRGGNFVAEVEHCPQAARGVVNAWIAELGASK